MRLWMYGANATMQLIWIDNVFALFAQMIFIKKGCYFSSPYQLFGSYEIPCQSEFQDHDIRSPHIPAPHLFNG